MNFLVRFNYAIALFVIFLGFIASYVTYQRNNVAPEKPPIASVEEIKAAIPDSPEPLASAAVPETGDWRYECRVSLEGMEACSALRRVMWEDGKTEALVAVLSMTKQEGAESIPRLKLMAPLGSFLPAGITMTLDKQDPFLVPFQACAVEGCFVNLDLAPDVAAAMETGALMVVEYMTPDQKIATVKIPLAGVDDVLARIVR